MMKSLPTSLLSACAFSLLAHANPVPSQSPDKSSHPGFVHPSNGNCKDITLNLPVTYPEMTWAYPHLKDDFDSAALVFNYSAKTGTFAPWGDGSTKDVTKTFEIAGTYCAPKESNKGEQNQKKLLIMTHGVGFDRRYWASSYKPEQYSWVQRALGEGYQVFYYDRIGHALSKRVSGYDFQAIAEQEVLAAIVKSFKDGKIKTSVKPEKTVLVGHSFGSFISNSILSVYPDLVDAAVLTGDGYAANGTVLAQNFIPGLFSLRIANKRPPGSSPQFAQSFDNGWLTFGDIYSYLLNFHHQPDYEVEAAQYAYSVTQPVSVTEFFSASGLTVPSPGFKGKVMVTTGKYDTALCDGECDRIYALKIADHIFPAAAQVLPYVHPNAGHGLNFEKNAPEYYTELLKFLASL